MSVRVRAPHKTNGTEAPSEGERGGHDGLETQRREPTDHDLEVAIFEAP
jgi:hypothetical protein